MRKSKSGSSNRWLKEHFSDVYVRKAKQEGMRARSAYKLIEIQERYNIVRPGMLVVDLGASPGGWSKYLIQLVGSKGKIFALDILPMQPIEGVEFIQGDFTKNEIMQKLYIHLNGLKADVILSDMAPNLSGVAAIDQARSLNLIESAFIFVQKTLKTGGTFLIKVFQGTGFDDFLKKIRTFFKEVKIIKPSASRTRSNEVFLLARDFKPILLGNPLTKECSS